MLMLAGAAMAIGVIFGRKPIKGSCGGLGAVGVERACGCKDVCENDQADGRPCRQSHRRALPALSSLTAHHLY